MDDCPNCANVEAQNAQLIGGIAGCLALIATEHEKQTMSRNELIRAINERLTDTLVSH